MRKILVLAVISLLFLGCTSEAVVETMDETEEVNEIPWIEENQSQIVENQTMGDDNQSELLTSETVFPELPVFDFSITKNGSLVVYFFHSPGCSACKASYPLIDELEEKYPDVIFERHDLSNANGTEAYKQFADFKNLSRDKRLVPQVYVNGTVITDRFNIEEKLEPIISEWK